MEKLLLQDFKFKHLQAIPSYRKIWILSYPIILSLLAQNIIAVIDTAFLGRVGEVELGASAIGGLFYYSIFMLGFGFGTGAQILMARRNGEKEYRQVGKIFDHTMYIFMAMSMVLIFVIHLLAPPFLGAFIASHAIYDASIRYLDYRVWGILFAFANVAFRAYYVGITKTGLLGWSAGIMAVVNIILDYGLIFGNLGLPKMGIEGAALASVIAECVSAVFFISSSLINRSNRKFHIFSFPRFDWAVVKRTWKLSVFIMLQNFVSIAGWFLFFLIIEQTGERPLAVSNIIRSLYVLLMIHVWSFSTSVNTLVSNAIGEGNSIAVIPIINKVNKMGMMISLAVIAVTFAIPDFLLRIYTNNPILIQEAKPVLFVVVGALIPMAVSINWFSGVSGTANTKTALLIEFSTIAIYLIYVVVLTFFAKATLPVIWTSEYVYIIILGLLSFLYMKFGNWRERRI